MRWLPPLLWLGATCLSRTQSCGTLKRKDVGPQQNDEPHKLYGTRIHRGIPIEEKVANGELATSTMACDWGWGRGVDEWGNPTATLLCRISVGFHLELRIAMIFLLRVSYFYPNNVSS